jgi:DNA repair photolyase
MNDKIKITTDSGEPIEAQAPVIISASRSTDIPAFYAQWLINRIKKGYVVWYNPFNQQPMYVSFQKTKAIVFWSKNPKPLIPFLKELDTMGIQYYFQFTLNDYEQEGFEPNVPPLTERIKTFKELSNLIGKEKVLWRFDPMILTDSITPREILKRVWNVGNQLKGYTDKLVFSFADIGSIYKKVENNLKREKISYIEFTEQSMNEIAGGLVKIRERWKQESWDISLSTCAEKIDLEKYGIEHNRCIDGELMKRIFNADSDLMYYLSYGKLPDKNSLFEDEISYKQIDLKDKGQRKICGCMISKDIGMYNTCRHHCVYCYANTSKSIVEKNSTLYDEERESIIGTIKIYNE